MKKNQLTIGICAVLLLASNLVAAEDYPAADFQPQVLFNDDSANSAAKQNQPKAASAVSVKPATSNVSVASTVNNREQAVTAVAKGEESSSTALLGLLLLAAGGGFYFYKNKQGSSSANGSVSASQYSFGKDSSGLSGVARYLKQQELSSASGVTKYLAKKAEAENASPKSGATGVEKYLKNRG